MSNDYRNLYNLVTHHSERKVGDIFHRAMLTVMLLRCMKKYGYFGPDAKDELLTEDECYVGTILNHFAILCTQGQAASSILRGGMAVIKHSSSGQGDLEGDVINLTASSNEIFFEWGALL